jgi:hypothetical protein
MGVVVRSVVPWQRWRWVASLALVSACAGNPAATSDTGGTTQASEGTETGQEPTMAAETSAPSSGDPGSTGGESSGVATTGGLPDYADSPCWGEPAETVVYDGQTHQTFAVQATCRAEGDRTLVYVQDELWQAGVDQDAINRFMHRFEIFTPASSWNPEQGVIQNNEAVFGALPEGKVQIFVVDTNGGGDGYLCGWCTSPQLHLDGVILSPLDGDFPVSIAAHESYHLIHRAIDPSETLWVDESLAEAAMTVNGFFTDTEWLADFLAEPDQNWGPGEPELGDFNYGAALLWGTLLWERGGPELMAAITSEPADDWEGLDAALARVGDDKTAWELYQDLMVAIYLDDPELGYGFEFFDVEDVAREGDLAGVAMTSGALAPYGMDFWRLTGQGTFAITVTGQQPVTALAVVATDTVTVTPVAAATEVVIEPDATAFLALTAQTSATYEIVID